MGERARCPICGGRVDLYLEEDAEEDEKKIAALRLRGVPFPFCSERCRAVDLARWVDEEYRVSEPILPRPETEEP